MRLEIDTTVPLPFAVDKADLQASVDSAEIKSSLSHGIKAAQAGNRAQARTSLLKVTELDPRNENAWLWLASISEYPEELLGFLNHVLEINPENQRGVEWKTATHALLSKTFVQRGVDASQQNQKDFAAECFQKALEYDEQNATAWMWMATLSDSNIVKVSLLEKALALDPGNEDAAEALEYAKASILKERLAEAKSAAIAGNHQEAINVLDSLLADCPMSVEAWTMKSHLSEGFDEKIRCFESILLIEPDNVAAKSGRDSLLSIFGTAEATLAEPLHESYMVAAVIENDAAEPAPLYLVRPTVANNPTDGPEMVVDFENAHEGDYEKENQNIPEEVYENEQPEIVAEPFASFAEETADPVEAAPVSWHQPAESSELTNSTFDYAAEEVYESENEHADSQVETVAFTHDSSFDSMQPDKSYVAENGDDPSNPTSEPATTIPAEPLPVMEMANPSYSVESHVEAAEVLSVKPESIECPFCRETNDPQVISCESCSSVLTLSDLELLLGNQSPNTMILGHAVEQMERERVDGDGDFGTDKLVTLGLGHLNLRNLQTGYSCLQEASRLSPNNVVLGAQVNSLLIRLQEIKKQDEAHLKMPKGKSILVVDDSPTVRKLIAGKLEKCGHTVICANDGVEAMDRLVQFVPDLVLLDITMPRMDGYQVCKQIRSNVATKDVTVVMISGKDGFFDKVRGRMAGTTGYITKPFGPETLMKAVEMYLSGEAPKLDEA